MVGNRFENLSQEYKTNGWFGRREKYNARLSVYIVVIQCNKGAFLHGELLYGVGQYDVFRKIFMLYLFKFPLTL